MPSLKAQLVNSVPPEVEIEERVWNYYYKKYKHMVITPELLMFIKQVMLDNEQKLIRDANSGKK